MPRAFLSYARSSADVVQALAADVAELGHEAWFDRSIGVGQAWWDEILAQIRRCDVFVACVSADWIESKASRDEWAYARALGKPVRLVAVEAAFDSQRLPPEMAILQYMAYDPEGKAAYLKLQGTLEQLEPAPALPDPLPEPPPPPISRLGLLGEQVRGEALLDPTQQDALVRELRRRLGDPEESGAVRSLLTALKRREDVTANARDDIVEALETDRRRRAAAMGGDPVHNPKASGDRFGSQAQQVVKRELARLGALREELERCFACVRLSNDLEIACVRAIEEKLPAIRDAGSQDWRQLGGALKEARKRVRDLESRLAVDDEVTAARAGALAETLNDFIVRVGRVSREERDEDPDALAREIAEWVERDLGEDAQGLAWECAERTRLTLRALQAAVNSLSKVLVLPEVPTWEASRQGVDFAVPSSAAFSPGAGGLRSKTLGRGREAISQGRSTPF